MLCYSKVLKLQHSAEKTKYSRKVTHNVLITTEIKVCILMGATYCRIVKWNEKQTHKYKHTYHTNQITKKIHVSRMYTTLMTYDINLQSINQVWLTISFILQL